MRTWPWPTWVLGTWRFSRSLLINQGFLWDWLAAFALIRVNRAVLKPMHHLERFCIDSDPTLSYPRTTCSFPHDLFWHLVFYAAPALFLACQAPLLLRGAIGAKERLTAAVTDWHAAMLSLTEAYAMAATLKHMMEHTGKLRPDWLERVATGNAKLMADGRQSYPSGHSLYTTMAAVLVSQYLMGKAGLLSRPRPGQFALLLVALLPVVVAVGVGLDRVECYDHDYVDSVAGGLAGAACGVIAYHLNFESLSAPASGSPKPRWQWGARDRAAAEASGAAAAEETSGAAAAEETSGGASAVPLLGSSRAGGDGLGQSV